MAKPGYMIRWGGPKDAVYEGPEMRVVRTPAEWAEINARVREQWLFDMFWHLDFTAWNRYHEWLMSVLPGGDDDT